MTGDVQIHVLPMRQGPPWLDVYLPTSGLGELHVYVGPTTWTYPQHELDGIAARVSDIVEAGAKAVGAALAADKTLCARCARTLIRSALGSFPDTQKVNSPATQADAARYAAANYRLGTSKTSLARAMAQLNADVATNKVEKYVTALAKRSTWAPLYESAGWPLQAGQWGDYRACACGAPGTSEKPVDMVGCAPNGKCSCGCGG